MRIKMLTDAPGSPDGLTVLDYAEGEVYDVTDDLGAVFVAVQFAEETDEDVTADHEPEPVAEDEDTAEETEQAEAEAKLNPPEENK